MAVAALVLGMAGALVTADAVGGRALGPAHRALFGTICRARPVVVLLYSRVRTLPPSFSPKYTSTLCRPAESVAVACTVTLPCRPPLLMRTLARVGARAAPSTHRKEASSEVR